MAYDSSAGETVDTSVLVRQRAVTPDEAIALLKPGQRLFVGTGCAQPLLLTRALAKAGPALADIEVVTLFTAGSTPFADPILFDSIHLNAFALADNIQSVIRGGKGDFTPLFLSELPDLFTSGRLILDAALIQVCPPDGKGFCSLGVSVDVVKAAVENARIVIAQINPRMPIIAGDGFIHMDEIDLLTMADEPLPEVLPTPPTEAGDRVARRVAGLVQDGATLQIGLGRIAQKVLDFLGDRRDLGIHTEALTDGIMNLAKTGAINGSCKTIDKSLIAASFCMGTRDLYDWVANNPTVVLKTIDRINDPFLISRQPAMTTINLALQVDLTGQVNTDSLGSRYFWGIGGEVDFCRGAARSKGGKAIVALVATSRDQAVSRIVSRLDGPVNLTRGDVHYVVTEYGVAYLHGKNLHQRALALISIAAPAFRRALFDEAIAAGLVHPDLSAVRERFMVASQDVVSSMNLSEDIRIDFRAIHPTDEALLHAFFYSLSQRSIYYRFMAPLRKLSQQMKREIIFVNHHTEAMMTGITKVGDDEKMVALGGYYQESPGCNRAEVALAVLDEWQGKGIGRFLLTELISLARHNGLSGLTATVLPANRAMQVVFGQCGLNTRRHLEEGVFLYELDFD